MKLKPSRCYRRALCPGSYRLEQLVKIIPEESEYAKERKRARELAADYLKNANRIRRYDSEEQETAIEFYISYVKRILDEGVKEFPYYIHEFFIEKELNIHNIHHLLIGTPDLMYIIRHPDSKKIQEINIFDFEYGYKQIQYFEKLKLLDAQIDGLNQVVLHRLRSG